MKNSKKQILGQYFTSKTIADFMVSLISPGRIGSRILDPGVGRGVFLEALKQRDYTNVNAFEIDEELYKVVKTQYSEFDIQFSNFFFR